MTTTALDDLLFGAIERRDVPGIVAIAVNRDGVLYEGAFGKARVAEDVPMAIDAIFRIASMTKAVTSAAALQLVERGVLSLDAPASEALPELADLQVLLPNGELRPAVRPVTLRHLLTHTSGFAYPFTNAVLGQHLAALPPDVPRVTPPLMFDPGDGWQYGTSTDWAGQMVEAASGQTLDEYMRINLFEPLGMLDTGFHVRGEKTARLVTQHNRTPLGEIVEQPFVAPAPPAALSGGGGLSSTARDYARFLRLILNGGELDGVRILGQEAMAGLTTGHSGEHPAGLWATAQPAFSCDTDFSHGGTARHSLGFVLSTQDSPGARSAGSLCWGGIFNTYYWIDPARGLAGATFCQFLPFADPAALAILDAFERQVYATFG